MFAGNFLETVSHCWKRYCTCWQKFMRLSTLLRLFSYRLLLLCLVSQLSLPQRNKIRIRTFEFSPSPNQNMIHDLQRLPGLSNLILLRQHEPSPFPSKTNRSIPLPAFVFPSSSALAASSLQYLPVQTPNLPITQHASKLLFITSRLHILSMGTPVLLRSFSQWLSVPWLRLGSLRLQGFASGSAL